MAVETQQQSLQDFLLDVSSRVRALEGRYNLLRDRVLLINNNMISEYKKVLGEIKVLNSDIKEIKTELFNIKETLKHVIAEIERTARKEDVKLLEKYINLWNPMNFVSETDVKKIVEETLKERSHKKEAMHGTPTTE